MKTADTPSLARSGRMRRALLWVVLLLLLGVAQTLLVALTASHESNRAQDETDAVTAEAAAAVRRDLHRAAQALQALGWGQAPQLNWRDGASELLKSRQDLRRIERRDPNRVVSEALDTPYLPQLFSRMARSTLNVEADLACSAARRAGAPMFSRSYFVPLPEGKGQEVLDLCVPLLDAGREMGYFVGSFALGPVLESVVAARDVSRHELSFVEGDGTRLARAGVPRGAGVFVAERVVDLPGTTLQLRADSAAGRPSLIPNLATALVLGLSIALFALVLLLARDVRRRAEAERALAEALAFRKAMEDSLITGLRARDLTGALTYVNPAFCSMVGFTPDELRTEPPPYWPPERVDEYARRQKARLTVVTQNSSISKPALCLRKQ